MRRLLAGFGAILAVTLGSAAAQAAPGYVTTNVNLRSGPGTQYPPVVVLGAGTPLEIFGCLQDYEWCDVDWAGNRGWVAGDYLEYSYQGRRVLVPQYAPYIGLPIVTFSFNDYWGRYYRGRSWYSSYDRWGPPRGPGWRPPPPHWGGPGKPPPHWGGPGKPPPHWSGGPGRPGGPGGPPPGGGRPPEWGGGPGRPVGPGGPPPGGGRPPEWGGGPGRPGGPGGRPPGGGRPPEWGGGPGQPGGPGGRPPGGGRPPEWGGGPGQPGGQPPGGGRPPQWSGGPGKPGGGNGGDRPPNRGSRDCPPGMMCTQ